MEEQIIKLLRENSLGKQTAVIESMDLGIYIWRKKIQVIKNFMDIEFNDLSEDEQKLVLSNVEKNKYSKSKSYQVTILYCNQKEKDMNCRIKIEELNNGEKRFIPQKRKSIFHVYTNLLQEDDGTVKDSLLRGIMQFFKTEQEALNVIEAYVKQQELKKDKEVKNVFYKLIS